MPKTIEALRQIVNQKQFQEWRYTNKRKPVVIDMQTAHAIVLCYDALDKTETKAKMERMIGGEFHQFQKIADFCLSKCK